ncbi:hypothetical protein BH23GEM10_BH23GEM10_09220 [soil metagenome]
MIRLLTVTVLCVMPLASPVSAQNPVFGTDSAAVADTIPDEAPVPAAAFVRALAIPGWGHAYIDEPGRGAVFFALQGTSWYMLLKTMSRLGDARSVEDRLTGLGRDSLDAAIAADTAIARRLSDPAAYETALDSYHGLQRARGLVGAREQQQQDWIVYTLVFTMAAAVDAYVTAHLKDFPAEFSAAPTRNGGAVLGMRVPVGRRR